MRAGLAGMNKFLSFGSGSGSMKVRPDATTVQALAEIAAIETSEARRLSGYGRPANLHIPR